MNRLRMAAIAFFSGVIVLTLAVIVYVENANSSHTVTVWEATADSLAGSAYTNQVATQISVRAEDHAFNYTTSAPADSPQVFRLPVRKGDIIRDDDLVAADAEVQIPINASGTANPGDFVDIYADSPGGQTVLVGREVPVVAGSGGSVTILVPRASETAWVVLTSSSGTSKTAASLHMVQVSKNNGGVGPSVSLDQAFSRLIQCANTNCDNLPASGSSDNGSIVAPSASPTP